MRRGLAIFATALLAVAAFVASQTAVPLDRATGAARNVRLEIRYDDGSGNTKDGTLRCRGSSAQATGYLRRRDGRRLCRGARELRDFLANPPQHEMCTELWGGPDRARIRGRIGGDAIDRRLARNDGCQIDDWNRAQPLLPKPEGAGGP